MVEDVVEFRQLDERIETDRWRQAELAFHATTGAEGLTQTAFALEVGKSKGYISCLVRIWGAYGNRIPGDRPEFSSAYDEIHLRADRRTETSSTYREDAKTAVRNMPASEKVQLIEELERDAEVQHQQAERRREQLDWPPPRDRTADPKPSDLLAAITRARQAMRDAAQSAGAQDIPEHLHDEVFAKLGEIKDIADGIADLMSGLIYLKQEL